MNRVRVVAVAVACGLAVAITVPTLGQAEAPPAPPPPPIVGAKTTEPMRVLQMEMEASPDTAEQQVLLGVQMLTQAAKAESISVLPGWIRLVVLTPLEDLQQGMVDSVKFAVQVGIIDDIAPGRLGERDDVKVVQTKPESVAYTYGRGPYMVAPAGRAMALIAWAMGSGYVPVGPIQMIVFQDPTGQMPDEVTFEVQVGVTKAAVE